MCSLSMNEKKEVRYELVRGPHLDALLADPHIGTTAKLIP